MNLCPPFPKKNSGEIAKKRLKFLLVSDKANYSPQIMEMIREDMIYAISKYIPIDSDGIEIKMTHTNSLYATIPIRSVSNKGII